MGYIKRDHLDQFMSPSDQPHANEASFCAADNVAAEVVVFVMDLLDTQAMSMAAALSLEFHEIAEALRVAQEVQMRLLLVAMARQERNVSSIPVTDFTYLPQALQALCELIKAQDRPVAWVMVPEEIRAAVTLELEKISDVWTSRTQGVIN